MQLLDFSFLEQGLLVFSVFVQHLAPVDPDPWLVLMQYKQLIINLVAIISFLKND